jgi:hypothetical protein
LLIDDSAGDNDGIFDPGETVNLKLVVENSGGSDIDNLSVLADLITDNSNFNLLENEVVDCLFKANYTDTVEFSAFVHEEEKPGNTVDIKFLINDNDYNYFNDSINWEVAIGKMEEYRINDTSSVVVASKVLFYDDGGSQNNYGNSQDQTITFYPENPRGILKVVFESFDVELNSSGGCWDYLSIFNGDSTNEEDLVDQFCNQSKPTEYLASNNSGALTFRFYSDATVTESGWSAVVENTGSIVKFIIEGSEGAVENAGVEFNNEEKYTNAEGIVIFNYVTDGEDLPYVIRKPNSKNYIDSVTVSNDTIVNIVMEDGIATFDVSFTITDGEKPIYNAQVILNEDTLYTNAEGNVKFLSLVESEDIPYKISKLNFNDIEGFINVLESNLIVNKVLSYKSFDITFRINDGAAPLEGATIDFGGNSGISDLNGEFVFNIQYSLNQVYNISKEGYDSISNMINVIENKIIEESLFVTTGLININENDFKVYPNPSSGIFNLEILNSRNNTYIVKIYDIIGSVVYLKNIKSNDNIMEQIDITNKSKGIYLLSVESDKGSVLCKRIITK